MRDSSSLILHLPPVGKLRSTATMTHCTLKFFVEHPCSGAGRSFPWRDLAKKEAPNRIQSRGDLPFARVRRGTRVSSLLHHGLGLRTPARGGPLVSGAGHRLEPPPNWRARIRSQGTLGLTAGPAARPVARVLDPRMGMQFFRNKGSF